MSKRMFFIFLFILLFYFFAHAQEEESGKYKKNLNMWHSIGFSTDILSARLNNSPLASQNGIFYSPSLGFKYEFGLRDFSFGADLSAKFFIPVYNFNYIYFQDSEISDFPKKRGIKELSFAFRFTLNSNYYFYNSIHYKWYVGVFAGISYNFGQEEKREFQFDSFGAPEIIAVLYKDYEYTDYFFGARFLGFRYEHKSGFFLDIVFLSLAYPLDISIFSPMTIGYKFNIY